MDFNPQSYSPDGTAIFGVDAQLLVKFFTHAELSQHKSKKEGRPIHDDVVMVSVIQPGEKEEVKVKAEDWHRARFPRQWEAFEKGRDHAVSGTRLEFLFPDQPSAIAELKAFHVHSVEQLSALSDTAINGIPRGRTLVEKAKQFLRDSGAGASFQEMENMRRELAELREKLLQQPPSDPSPEEISQPVRRGPGRPPKVQGDN